jgi:ribosomal protein S6
MTTATESMNWGTELWGTKYLIKKSKDGRFVVTKFRLASKEHREIFQFRVTYRFVDSQYVFNLFVVKSFINNFTINISVCRI